MHSCAHSFHPLSRPASDGGLGARGNPPFSSSRTMAGPPCCRSCGALNVGWGALLAQAPALWPLGRQPPGPFSCHSVWLKAALKGLFLVLHPGPS